MKKRVTVRFKSNSQNEYLYDDSSSMIYPWNELREKIVCLLEKYDETETLSILKNQYDGVEEEINEITYLKHRLNAFYRESRSYKEISSSNLKEFIEENFTEQLTLCLTNQCNMRCKYCIYSDNYTLTKGWDNKYMTEETALQAVNYFIEIIRNKINKNPSKKYMIGFYGGEPLLNINVIQKVINHVKNCDIASQISYTITTNGLLLTEEIISYLVSNRIFLIISLDGPRDEHDRLRVGLNDQGTYDTIIKKIDFIRLNYLDYFNSCIGLSSVYDFCSDLVKIESFFSEKSSKKMIPPNYRVSGVSNISTNYYDKSNKSDYVEYDNRINQLKSKLLFKLNTNEICSSYLESLIGFRLVTIHARRRQNDRIIDISPSSGACIPGKKLYVECNGDIQICEKVNGHNPIGDIWSGINEEKVAHIINKFGKLNYEHCSQCSISNLCQLCYIHFEDNNGFICEKDRNIACSRYKEDIINDLVLYSSAMEINESPSFLEKIEKINLT